MSTRVQAIIATSTISDSTRVPLERKLIAEAHAPFRMVRTVAGTHHSPRAIVVPR